MNALLLSGVTLTFAGAQFRSVTHIDGLDHRIHLSHPRAAMTSKQGLVVIERADHCSPPRAQQPAMAGLMKNSVDAAPSNEAALLYR